MIKLHLSFSGLLINLAYERVTLEEIIDHHFFFGCMREHFLDPRETVKRYQREALEKNGHVTPHGLRDFHVCDEVTRIWNGRQCSLAAKNNVDYREPIPYKPNEEGYKVHAELVKIVLQAEKDERAVWYRDMEGSCATTAMIGHLKKFCPYRTSDMMLIAGWMGNYPGLEDLLEMTTNLKDEVEVQPWYLRRLEPVAA